MKKNLILLFLGVSIFTTFMAAKTEVIELLGSKFNVYDAQKGETLDNIAQENNWDITLLKKYNPDLSDQLSKNDPVFYPINETIGNNTFSKQDNGSNVDKYIVKNGETLAEIAEANNVSVASIFDVNYGLTPDNFNMGIEIKIPVTGSGLTLKTEIIEEKNIDSFTLLNPQGYDNWENIASAYNMDPKLIETSNPQISNLKKASRVAVPVITISKKEKSIPTRDNREFSESGIREIYKDIHGSSAVDSVLNIRVSILTDTHSGKKDLEFIRGFLAGVKKVKDNRYKISLKVVDGTRPNEEVVTLLNSFGPNLIISTTDKALPSFLGNYAKENNTLVINAFETRNEEFYNNPYMIQLLAPASFFNENVAKNAHKKYSGYKLVMVGEEDENDLLSQSLKQLWDSSDIKYLPTGSFDALTEEDLNSSKLLFYGYPTKKEEVKNILTGIKEIVTLNPLVEYAVLARPNWILFGESLKNELQAVNTAIPSRFYIDNNSDIVRNFTSEFSNLYKVNPTKGVPMHAATGYDIATYFIPELAKNNLDINYFSPSLKKIQTAFDLKRINNWSGFINYPVYLIDYNQDGTIQSEVIE